MRLLTLLFGAALAVGCVRAPVARPTAPADTVRIDGSPGVMPLVAALAREYRARHPAPAIVLGGGLGAQARLQALAERRIDVAMASHGVVEDDIERRGMTAHEIAKVPVVFGVNASVPVAGLTGQQLCALYAGEVTNWRQLGGPDLAVAPRMRPPTEVDAEVATSRFACLRSAATSGAVRTLEKPDEMARELAAAAGAVGMTSMPFVEASGGAIRALSLDGVAPTAENVRRGTYALTRRSFLLTHATASPAVARFLAFVRSPEGARVIVANGAVPVP